MIKHSDFKNKGVSTVIGAIIMFGFLIVALSVYQASIVPVQNAGVEHSHFQEVQQDNIRMHSDFIASKTTRSGSSPITTTRGYPTRLFTVNPPPITTTISGTQTTNTTITNFDPAGSGNEADYWADRTEFTLETSKITTTPDYNEWGDEPEVVYESQILYTNDPTGKAVISSDTPVSENRISLLGVYGEFSESTRSVYTVNNKSVSSSANTIRITGANNNPIELRFASEVSVDNWINVLNADQNPNIQSVQRDGSQILVELDPSIVYTVNGSQTTVQNSSISDSRIGSPEYIVSNSGSGVLAGQSIELEVRDGLGNSTSNAEVIVSSDPNNCVNINQKSTGPEGSVTFTCDAQQDTTVEFQINNGNNSYETIAVDVFTGGGGGGGGGTTATMSAVSASNFNANSSGETQTTSIDLNQDLTQGDTITIDLSNAQGNNTIVDYGSSSVNLQSGSGSVQIVTQNPNNFVVEYTAGQSDIAGDTIQVDITQINTDPGNSTFTAEFVYDPTGETKTDDFTVS